VRETESFVEPVRVGPTLCSRQEQELTVSRLRLGFSDIDERTTDPAVAMRIVDDEGRELRRGKYDLARVLRPRVPESRRPRE
jgi:hypothetical protein